MKENEHIVFKTNQYPKLENGIVIASLQLPEPKILGGKGENGVITSLVLSMRPQHKIMIKRDISSKYAIYFEKPYAHFKKLYQSIKHIHYDKTMYITRPTILILIKNMHINVIE